GLVPVGVVDQEVDLLEILLLVVVQPRTVPDLEAVLAGTLRHGFEVLAGRIGAHRLHLSLQATQVVLDLIRRREAAAERALARSVGRERHALQRCVGPAGDLDRPVGPPPPQEIERRHDYESQQRHQGTHGELLAGSIGEGVAFSRTASRPSSRPSPRRGAHSAPRCTPAIAWRTTWWPRNST